VESTFFFEGNFYYNFNLKKTARAMKDYKQMKGFGGHIPGAKWQVGGRSVTPEISIKVTESIPGYKGHIPGSKFKLDSTPINPEGTIATSPS
jgi:hypothetical protein